MKITSKQVNALYEVTADTDEPISIEKIKRRNALKVKIGRGKRAILWRIDADGITLAIDNRGDALPNVKPNETRKLLAEPVAGYHKITPESLKA